MSAPEPSDFLVLNLNVEIVPVREFPMDVRQRLGGSSSDFILSDRTSRITSQRIEEDAAKFLRRFREPRRIVDAVVEHSAELQRDPAQVLDEVYPMVRMLRAEAFLVDPGRKYSRVLGPGLSPGDFCGGHRILECVSDLIETEVYKGESSTGSLAAIKYLRSGSEETVRENLSHETRVLQHLGSQDSSVAPRLYGADLQRDDPYIWMEWICGRTLFNLNQERKSPLEERAGIIFSLLKAYMRLHKSGVLHGDVHPRNVLVLVDGSVRLIDFGGARLGVDDFRPRIGIVQYYEPEVAQAILAGETAPQPSERGEQYAVASLAYSVITHASPLVLSLETETALNQLVKEPPRPFHELGVMWPAVEAVLLRALSKSPADRFATFEEFSNSLSAALRTTTPSERPALPGKSFAMGASVQQQTLEKCCRRFIERYGLGSDLMQRDVLRGPTASLYSGAAGIAYALLRVACLREDPALLATADVWISRAEERRHESMAFTDGSVGAATETGPLGLFHSETGVYAVKALIRHASGDELEAQSAVTKFIDSIPVEAFDPAGDAGLLNSFSQDATNGAASLLLGAALLAPLCVPEDGLLASGLRKIGEDLCGIVLDQLNAASQADHHLLGFAHGRTGAIYSVLQWAKVSSAPPPHEIIHALDELAALGQSQGQGLVWPIDLATPNAPAWTGWCHGSAGHILTWIMAAQVLQRPDYLELALGAGRHIWESKGQSGPSLCCGGAGEALSLFELARACDDGIWIDRGVDLATKAVEAADQTHAAQGLFRAGVGIALSAAESLSPATSSWPICESPLKVPPSFGS